MLSDPKYINNVIMQEQSMQELLTNIKNYPVIDIEDVDANELDETTNLNVWQNYTNNQPCVKIIYGDETTTKGNIIFAEIFKKVMSKAKAKIRDLENANIENIRQHARWKEIYELNKSIYNARKENLDNYAAFEAEQARHTARDIVDTICSLANSYNHSFDQYWVETDTPDVFPNYSKVRMTLSDSDGVFYEFNAENGMFPCLTSVARDEGIATMRGLQMIYEGSNNANDQRLYNAYKALGDDIEAYPNYDQMQNGFFELNATSEKPREIYNYIKNYLTFVVNSAEIKMNAAKIIMESYQVQNSNDLIYIERLETMITICTDLIEKIASTEFIIKNTSENVKAITGTQQVTFQNPENTQDTFTANDEASFVEAVYKGYTQLNAENDLDPVEGNNQTDKTIYGYKYIKVGSNVTTGSTFGTINVNGRAVAVGGLTGSDNTKFLRGDGVWANELMGPFTATKVYNAVYNDYAECRTTIDCKSGCVVADNDDGSLYITNKRLIPGAQVVSDTYGNLMGKTEEAQTPIAVAGRVLVYTYQPRENYHAGMAVCSAPNGTVDIMSREEIRDYPDCVIGIVSEIPQYEFWGTDNVKVNGRIWIKVR